MSKKSFKSHASSSRVVSQSHSGFGATSNPITGGFGSAPSTLSYLAEQPDLSSLADPNVVVQFKNLAKKDSTTKVKALEELQNHVASLKESQVEVDDAFLIAWVKVYPRASIDGFRRVRQLAHTIHGQVFLNGGRRVAKHMPSVVGPWFAGAHDSDRAVLRAANEAFETVFPTTEKRSALPKAYQPSILEFCSNAILHESVHSLSDERTTKAEDAEAKFSRVVSSNVLTLCFLLDRLPQTEILKQSPLYSEILSADKLWDFQASKDQTVRRSIFRLLRVCLGNHKDLISDRVDQISTIMLSKQVLRHQRGTATDYSASLAALSAAYPSFWTAPTQRQLGISRFAEFVKIGSQGASEIYWKEIAAIFGTLPKEALPSELDAAVELLNALKTGLTRKEEPRSNAESAWECYILVANRVASALSVSEKMQLASASMLPIIQQYINPTTEHSDWTILGPRPLNTIARLVKNNEILQEEVSNWSTVATKLCADIEISAAEQSKDFESSQNSISGRGMKWIGLHDCLSRNVELTNLNQNLRRESVRVLAVSIETLAASNGKLYGVAQIIEAAVTSLKPSIFQDETTSQKTDQFIRVEIPRLIFSPSHSQLIAILYESQQSTAFIEAWNLTLQTIVKSENSAAKLPLLQELLTCSKAQKGFDLPLKSPQLQNLLQSEIDRAITGALNWAFFAQLASAPILSLSPETTDYMLSKISESLTIDAKASNSLAGLELLVRDGQEELIESFQNQKYSSLRQNILLLTESDDEILAQRAVELNARIEEAITNEAVVEPLTRSTLNVLAVGWYEANQKSLTVETLVELGERYIENTQSSRAGSIMQIIPSLAKWTAALDPMVAIPVSQSLAMSTQLGEALFMVDSVQMEDDLEANIQYDRDGYSAPLRMALYMVNIVENDSLFEILVQEIQAEIFRLLLLTIQLVNENISIAASNNLWSSKELSIEDEMLDLVSRTGMLFKRWLQRSGEDNPALENDPPTTFVGLAQHELWVRIKGQSPPALRHARAYSYIISEYIELHGWKSKSEKSLEARFKQLRQSDNNLMLMAFVAAYKAPLSNTQIYAKTCNELVAKLTGMAIKTSPNEVLRQLVLLDVLFEGQEQIIESVAKQRIIFFVKQVISWLQDEQTGTATKTEICKLLTMMFPAIKDVYGTHWFDTLNFLVHNWSEQRLKEKAITLPARLPFEIASLRLLSKLQRLAFDEESIEDLRDAWQDSLISLVNGMMGLLEWLNVSSDSFNQPLRTVNEYLGRLIASMPVDETIDVESLYSLIAMESIHVQRTAFDILHKKIPKMQEQISLDAALENSTARLPEELLSLIIYSPSQKSLTDAAFSRNMPASVRGFLSSWLLVFDHFKSASDKVRNDYTTHLKEGNYLQTLLEFMFDALGHSKSRPVDVSKFDITVYSFDIEESPARDFQWLLAHLYFLCLKRTPAITKSWWMECKSRQTVISVESWTEKFISPSLITDALTTVNEWAATQDTSSSESVSVKTNSRTKEVVVSKEVDDQVMSMVIRLPDNFPLGQAVLHGINRVAVDEKKWRSWLLNSQGVITFSNNSLIDGIVAFRRNVVGALKGQTECAICYSIVGADKQLPTKKCGTCNNLFHGSCLYRWFKSSNSSSCPLCRNPFNYS